MSRPPEPQAAVHGGLLRSVMVLASSAALAHGITALAMPVLSRIYSPSDFGLLAVFSGFLAILSVAGCLRYELAIALPDDDAEARQLLALSLAICLGLSLMLASVLALAPQWVLNQLGQPGLAPYLWLLPLGLLLSSSYGALQLWFVRERNFRFIARTRIAQSGACAGTQITLGAAGWHPVGLLAGYLMNTGVACIAMGKALAPVLSLARAGQLRELAWRYRRFPLYSTLEALANSAAIQLPVILIAAATTPAEAGQLAMAMFVAQAPLSLLGTAISQVYLSQAPAAHRAGRLAEFSLEMLGNLSKAGAGPLLALGILAPAMFPLVFGPGWERAGSLVSWMTPWFLAQFLSTPLSMALHVCARQRTALWLQLVGLGLRLGPVWLCQQLQPSWASETYAATGAVFYLAYLIVILHVVGASAKRTLDELRRHRRQALAWVGLAAIVSAGIWAARA